MGEGTGAHVLREGDKVTARYGGDNQRRNKLYKGTVRVDNGDGTYAIDYEDGDEQQSVKASHINLVERRGGVAAEVTEMRTWRMAELTEALQQRQLDTNGRRDELMDRLEDAIRGGDASLVVQAVAASVMLRARVSLTSFKT